MTNYGRTLLAFVDYQDPYAQSLVGDEEQPGPVLTLLDTGGYDTVALFHTPHTEAQSRATLEAIGARHPRVRTVSHGLAASNPKDFSRLIGLMAPHLKAYARHRRETGDSGDARHLVPAEHGQLQARLLQVKQAELRASGRRWWTDVSRGRGW